MPATSTPTSSLASSERGRALTILAAILIMLVVHWLPEPAPIERAGDLIALTPNGKACLAILAFAITLWVTEAIPFAVTALFVLLLVPIFGIADYATTVRAGFGNTLVTFFIGVLFLSTGFTRSGLGTRLVLHMLRVVGTRTDRVLLGFLVIGALLSMWITDMAVAAVLLPLGVGILKDAGAQAAAEQLRAGADDLLRLRPPHRRHRDPGRRRRQSGRGRLPARAGRGGHLVRALDGLRVPRSAAHDPGLLADPAARVPAGDRPPADRGARRSTTGSRRSAVRPAWRSGPSRCSPGTITTWLTTPLLADLSGGLINPPTQAVALGGGLLLFLPGLRVLVWKEAQRDMDWGGVVLIVAGLSLGVMVFETGAARWLAQVMLGRLADVPGVLQPFIIVLVVAALHMLFSSNTVTGAIIMPILIALAQDLGLDVWTIAAPAAFTSTLAFILVTESPTNVLPYSAGYFSIRDMAKVGIVMDLRGGCLRHLSPSWRCGPSAPVRSLRRRNGAVADDAEHALAGGRRPAGWRRDFRGSGNCRNGDICWKR